MSFDSRRLAIAIAGFSTFINLYAPQALLPTLAREFAVGAAEISSIMTASALAVAVTAPFTGAVADVLGRKRVITAAMLALILPTIMIAMAPSLQALMFWRFAQGLLLPPIFVVAVAYIGDEWPVAQVASVAGIYTTGASLGGFAGRFIPGILDDLLGWRAAFLSIALITLLAATVVALTLQRERNFVRSEGIGASMGQMLRHLQDPQLLATYAIGFGVLFNFIATFTYLSFHLAAPPYGYSSALLGSVFFTYLAGAAATLMAGRAIARFGRRRFMLGVIVMWAFGALLTLAHPITFILAGLTLCAACGLLCQAVSTGYVTLTAREGRSSAVGLYVTTFYVGGSIGAFLPGLVWESAGWPAVIAMVIVMLALMALIVGLVWTPGAGRAARH
jgi:predicted MFS family arabinose efflux permease